jgi:subtilisin family serine protease
MDWLRSLADRSRGTMTRRGITIGLATLLAAIIVVSAPAFGQDAEERIEEQGGTAYVPGEVVVAREDGSYAVRQVEAETLGDIQEEAEEIEEEKNVIEAGPNYAYELALVPNDLYFNQQYNLGKIRVEGVWDHFRGEGVTIGFVDTGYYRHPDLDAKVRGERDFVESEPPDSEAQDSGYHGTAVVGVAAAETDNGEGIASVGFQADFVMAKGCEEWCFSSDTAPALDWLVDQGVEIINLSFGAEQQPPGDPVLGLAVQRARGAGVLVIAAAGNDGDKTGSFYPAAYPGVLGVAAVDQNNAPARFSNYGPVVDVAAPGVNITSTYNPHSPENTTGALYGYFSGTSFAAPHVAGVAALLKAKNPELPAERIAERIQIRATDIGPRGNDDRSGSGLLDAGCSVNRHVNGC